MPKPPPKKYLPRGIRILFEDSDLVIIDKPAGMLSVPARYEPDKNALSLMTHFFRKGNPKSKKELFAVNRLDRETSGILVFAKSFAFREKLHEAWDEVEKTYFAVVCGNVEKDFGIIESWLVEDENYRVRSVPAPLATGENALGSRARFAATHYEVLRRAARWTSLRVRLLTGRKNQIRVHFSEAGHPLIGDKMYGRGNAPRLALHAEKLAFTHPRTRERIEITCEIPPFFFAYAS
ncbi:MAG: RluA family pseudouridine synthase [Opitutales bacterium]|nr:RluA family pseudouridine synthase [Verrucomicrobiota bacterium]MBQ2732125.1 RluA family pseudouridine synthase [Opitutales bacterium]